MDAGLDNANNPFAISNGSGADNILSQKSDGLLLNLTDNFKQNGTENRSPSADFYEKPNGKRRASDFGDDDLGPETNVDTVDDAFSPMEPAKGFQEIFTNNNPAEGVFNPFMEHQEKAAMETERIQKQLDEDFEERRLAREETPTPPADAVHDVTGLVDNAADSESEDEWNYIKGEEANKENISPQPNREVAEIPEEDDNMSQLNPNAAEFVPVSPTRSIPSPACRTLLNDQVISQSPKRPVNDIDINLPNPVEFEKEVKSRPSEVDSFSNGHDSDSERNITSPTDLMENLLNGKNIDEIPEFQPGSTPSKVTPSDEFHFGPNAAPFTPAKLLDQSEAALSTKAVFGDESTATLGTSFNESVTCQDATDLNLLNKESDPMSMSFYADKGDSNPFDLNEVQILPDNIDEFLKKPDSSMFNDTISDLPEHHPLGDSDKNNDLTLNNDDAIQITDLDKQSYDDEKELASPLEPEKEFLEGGEDPDVSKTPEPTHENLLGDFCHIPEKLKTSEVESLARDVELISPEPTGRLSQPMSPKPSSLGQISGSSSPVPPSTEVDDMLKTYPESLPRDVELVSPDNLQKLLEPSSRLESDHSEKSISPFELQEKELERSASDLLGSCPENSQPKSPLPEANQIHDILEEQVCKLPQVNLQTSDLLESNSPVCERLDMYSPVCDLSSKSPVCDIPESKSPVCEMPESKLPVCELPASKSPVHELPESMSPVCELPALKSPVCEFPESKSPVCELRELKSPVFELPDSRSPVCEFQAKSPVCDFESKSPNSEHYDYTKSDLVDKAQQHFDEIFKSKEGTVLMSTQEEISSLKIDNLATTIPNQIIEDSFVADQSTLQSDTTAAIEKLVKEEVTTPILQECPIPSPKSIADSESIATADVNSFLDRSLPPEVASPLSPTEQQIDVMKKCLYSVNNDQGSLMQEIDDFVMVPSSLPNFTEEQIDIKTENIAPEFAEQAVITPSEESKQEEIPSAPLLEEVVKEPLIQDNKFNDQNEAAPVVAAVAGVATAAAVAGVVATKTCEKKKTPTTASKKPAAPKSAPTRQTPKTTSAPAPKPATRVGTAPKASPPKTGPTRPPTTTAPKPAATKPLPKPKTTTAPKPTERKPLTNGDVKPAVRSTLTARKVTSESTITKTSTPRPATASAKLSPTKTTAKPAAATRPATAPLKTTTTRLVTTSSTVTAKPGSTSLANKSSPTAATKTNATTKAIPPKSSPRTTLTPKPKPPVSTTLAKPRVPLTKTVSKAPDTEKQNKESANKLTASRNLTSSTKTTGSVSTRTTSNTVRKVESKTIGPRTTVSKTTTTTMKSTTAKKPVEIVRTSTGKTKTTKIEKPKENGVSTVVTEEINIVTSTIIDSEPQLIKDNSPVDNKLIIDNTLIQTNTAD